MTAAFSIAKAVNPRIGHLCLRERESLELAEAMQFVEPRGR